MWRHHIQDIMKMTKCSSMPRTTAKGIVGSDPVSAVQDVDWSLLSLRRAMYTVSNTGVFLNRRLGQGRYQLHHNCYPSWHDRWPANAYMVVFYSKWLLGGFTTIIRLGQSFNNRVMGIAQYKSRAGQFATTIKMFNRYPDSREQVDDWKQYCDSSFHKTNIVFCWESKIPVSPVRKDNI